jgi:hypothetical protein
MPDKLRDEFIFRIGDHKFYTFQDLDYFDDILIAENKRFWNNVVVYIQRRNGFSSSKPKQIASLPIKDVIKKFG